MFEAYIRPIYQLYIVNPIAKRTSFSPQQITYLACLSGMLAALALVFNFHKIAILLLLMSGFLDTLDGTVARMENTTSYIGTVSDILSDRIVELAMILGLFFVDPVQRAFTSMMMLGSCYLCVTSFLIVGIFTSNQSTKGFHYSIGLVERFEAFMFFIAMIIWPQHFTFIAYVFSVLVLLTAYLHIKEFILRVK